MLFLHRRFLIGVWEGNQRILHRRQSVHPVCEPDIHKTQNRETFHGTNYVRPPHENDFLLVAFSDSPGQPIPPTVQALGLTAHS